MSGLLFFHPELGRAGCPKCGWSGVPTYTDGERVGPPRRANKGWPLSLWTVINSTRSDQCPCCENLPYDLNADAETVKVKKVGRNEPCPCGSGRKFKKCCGGN